ncbi:MAG: 5' nucleotidase, NT5C type [Clostridia bacterium]
MKIGIDIDGVLTNTSQFMITAGSRFAQKTGKGVLIDRDAFDVIDMFGWDEETTAQFWEENIFDYAKNNPILPFAAEVIQSLKEEENEIYIITARIFSERLDEKGLKMRNTVKQWLKDNQVIYNQLLFTKESKKTYCQAYQIELMIEDSPKNIIELADSIPVICMDMPYNRQVQVANMTRCANWKQIYDTIQQMQAKNK